MADTALKLSEARIEAMKTKTNRTPGPRARPAGDLKIPEQSLARVTMARASGRKRRRRQWRDIRAPDCRSRLAARRRSDRAAQHRTRLPHGPRRPAAMLDRRDNGP